MTKVCQKCSTKNIDEAIFCEQCGNNLFEDKSRNKKEIIIEFISMNWIPSTLGFIFALILTLITVPLLHILSPMIILPIGSGLLAVYLANNTKYLEGSIIGILSILILSILTLFFLIGFYFLVVAAIGGLIGVLINRYVFKTVNDDNQRSASRVVAIQNFWDKQGNDIRVILLISITILGIALFLGIVFASL